MPLGTGACQAAVPKDGDWLAVDRLSQLVNWGAGTQVVAESEEAAETEECLSLRSI